MSFFAEIIWNWKVNWGFEPLILINIWIIKKWEKQVLKKVKKKIASMLFILPHS
jgi:hypothetical protein